MKVGHEQVETVNTKRVEQRQVLCLLKDPFQNVNKNPNEFGDLVTILVGIRSFMELPNVIKPVFILFYNCKLMLVINRITCTITSLNCTHSFSLLLRLLVRRIICNLAMFGHLSRFCGSQTSSLNTHSLRQCRQSICGQRVVVFNHNKKCGTII